MFKRWLFGCMVSLCALIVGLQPVRAQETNFNVREIPVASRAALAKLSPDGEVLAVYELGEISNFEIGRRYLWLVNVQTGEEIATVSRVTDYVSDVAFTSSGDVLASFHTNGDIALWDVRESRQLKRIELPFYYGGRMLHFLSDDKTLVFTHGDPAQIILLDTETEAITDIVAPHFPTRQALTDVLGDGLSRMSYMYAAGDLSPDGTQMAVANASDKVFVWDLESRRQTVLREESEARGRFGVYPLTYSADGSTLAFALYAMQEIHIVDAATGETREILPIKASAFAPTPDGSAIAWIDREDPTLYFAPVDQVDQPTAILTLDENLRVAPRLTSLNFSPDGATLILSGLFGSDESTIYLVEMGE